MIWGVWCVRSGGQLGSAQTWMKENGARWMGTQDEAIAKARDTQQSSDKTFARADRLNPLSYVAREITQTGEIS